MILKQLLSLLVTLSIILFVGTFAWYMLSPVFPALAYFDFVRVSAVGIVIVICGRGLSDLPGQLNQLQSKQEKAGNSTPSL